MDVGFTGLKTEALVLKATGGGGEDRLCVCPSESMTVCLWMCAKIE